jgi:hypothetical protein
MFKLILMSVLFLVGEINLFPIRQPLLNTQVPLLTQLNNASLTNRWGLSLLELNQSAKPIIKIFDDEYNASGDPALLKKVEVQQTSEINLIVLETTILI